jgi:SEC-C motif
LERQNIPEVSELILDFADMTAVELVDRLFKEEDRVKREHIDELIARGETAAAPLREILINEDYWYEGLRGDYWIVVHAIIVLAAMRDEKALPDLIELVPHAFFSNHHDAISVLPAALAQYGEYAVESYLTYIREYRGAYYDNADYAFCRNVFSAAATRIALENHRVRSRVTDFICNLFSDPEEDDSLFLSNSAAHPVALDQERGLKVVQEAYQRGVISESITGKFERFMRLLKTRQTHAYDEIEIELFDFYTPRALKERQKKRANEKIVDPYRIPVRKSLPTAISSVSEEKSIFPEKIGRNDPCPCGSGKKYKKCCGA